MIHKAYTRKDEACAAFTLAEIALTLGIVVSTGLLALALLGSVAKWVQRLKHEEAPLRPQNVVNPTIYRPDHPLPDCVDSPLLHDQQSP